MQLKSTVLTSLSVSYGSSFVPLASTLREIGSWKSCDFSATKSPNYFSWSWSFAKLDINFLRALLCSSSCWLDCGGLLTVWSFIFKLTFIGCDGLFCVCGLFCWPPPRWLVMWSGIVNSKLSNFSCWLGVARYVNRLFPGAWWIGRMKSRFMSLGFLGFG